MDEKYFIASENYLESFICSKCYNYMSVGPFVIIKGQFVCGRCDQTGSTVTPVKDEDIKMKLFRCVNRFDGCRELLKFSDVQKHEQRCLNRKTMFYCCLCPRSGNLCQLYNHYKLDHHCIQEKLSFELHFKEERLASMKHVIRDGDFLFVVQSESIAGTIVFHILNYGKNNFKYYLRYNLQIMSSATNSSYFFKTGDCMVNNKLEGKINYNDTNSVDVSVLKKHLKAEKLERLQCEINFIIDDNEAVFISYPKLNDDNENPCPKLNDTTNISEKDILNNLGETETSKLSPCSLQTTQRSVNHVLIQTDLPKTRNFYTQTWKNSEKKVYFANRKLRYNNDSLTKQTDLVTKELWKLFKCSNCEAYVCSPIIYWCTSEHIKCDECISDFCHICKEVSNYGLVNDGREDLLELVAIPCRWLCGKTYSSQQPLRNHEYDCSKRKYKCPLFCEWVGSLDSMQSHWHSENTQIVRKECKVHYFQKTISSFCVVCDKDFYHCLITKTEGNRRNIHVRKGSAVGDKISNIYAIVTLTVLDNNTRQNTSKVYLLELGKIKPLTVPTDSYYVIKVEFKTTKPTNFQYL